MFDAYTSTEYIGECASRDGFRYACETKYFPSIRRILKWIKPLDLSALLKKENGQNQRSVT